MSYLKDKEGHEIDLIIQKPMREEDQGKKLEKFLKIWDRPCASATLVEGSQESKNRPCHPLPLGNRPEKNLSEYNRVVNLFYQSFSTSPPPVAGPNRQLGPSVARSTRWQRQQRLSTLS